MGFTRSSIAPWKAMPPSGLPSVTRVQNIHVCRFSRFHVPEYLWRVRPRNPKYSNKSSGFDVAASRKPVMSVDCRISGGNVSRSGSVICGRIVLVECSRRFEIWGAMSGRFGFEYTFVIDCARDSRRVEVFDHDGLFRSNCAVINSVQSSGENNRIPPSLRRENSMIFVMTYD
jgi:hypothetical protein